jgi:hypothetical protein
MTESHEAGMSKTDAARQAVEVLCDHADASSEAYHKERRLRADAESRLERAEETIAELRAKQPAEKPRPKHVCNGIIGETLRCDCTRQFPPFNATKTNQFVSIQSVNELIEHVLSERGKAKPTVLTREQCRELMDNVSPPPRSDGTGTPWMYWAVDRFIAALRERGIPVEVEGDEHAS